MSEPSLLGTAVRTGVIYVLMLAVIRLLGKRTVGNLTSFDMLIALVMGDLAGTAIYGQAPLAAAFVAVATLAVLHYANSWLAYGTPRLRRILEGEPTVIVEHGAFVAAGLRRERMSREEVLAELRLEGIDALADVRQACVEPDGRVSVLLEDRAEPLRRADVATVT